jgi:hypothetical protein
MSNVIPDTRYQIPDTRYKKETRNKKQETRNFEHPMSKETTRPFGLDEYQIQTRNKKQGTRNKEFRRLNNEIASVNESRTEN